VAGCCACMSHLDVHHVVSTHSPQLPELWCQLLTHCLQKATYGVTLAHSNLQPQPTHTRTTQAHHGTHGSMVAVDSEAAKTASDIRLLDFACASLYNTGPSYSSSAEAAAEMKLCPADATRSPHLSSVSAAVPVTINNLQGLVLDSFLLCQPLLQHTSRKGQGGPVQY
jgi:hypothetical protein